MARESTQHKIDRVRRPRVHITYDVETGGAIEKKEIPFVVGVLADLSAQPKDALPRIEDRKFEEIDRDNLDQLMAKHKPRLTLKVANKLTPDENDLRLELKFNKLADFHPENVANQVEPLRKLLELRKKLSNLRNIMTSYTRLENVLQEAIDETEKKRGRKEVV